MGLATRLISSNFNPIKSISGGAQYVADSAKTYFSHPSFSGGAQYVIDSAKHVSHIKVLVAVLSMCVCKKHVSHIQILVATVN